jgi:hypothetical protein
MAGRKEEDENGGYLHRGIARRTFERRFSLADHMKVTGASLNNGLLSVDVVREVPAAELYADHPTALQLRAMNIIYETTKERGTTILIPTSMVDSMNPASALVAHAQPLGP